MRSLSVHLKQAIIKKFCFFSPSIRMSRKNVNCGYKKSKIDFYKNKKLTQIYDIDVNKI